MSGLNNQYIIAQEEHDYNKKYEQGTIVKHTIDDTVTSYIARKNVPQFISILNENYWKKIASTEEGGIVDYDNVKNKPSINGVELEGNVTSKDLGIDNKFKGWYNTLAELKAAHTAADGYSAYVKDASPATTWSIYVYDSTASSDKYWVDSGTDADTSNVQTFASSQEVNEVHIVNDLNTGGVNDVLSAEQGKIINQVKTIISDLGWKNNKYINYNDGNMNDSSIAAASIYIELPSDSIEKILYYTRTCVTNTGYQGIAFYNSTKTFISGISPIINAAEIGLEPDEAIIPNNAKYIRFSCPMSCIEEFSAYYTENINEKVIQLDKTKVDILIGKNLYNPTTDKVGYYLNASGQESVSNSYNISDFISVTPGYQYSLTSIDNNNQPISIGGAGGSYYNFYNSNKEYVSSIQNTSTLTIPENIYFIRVSIYKGYNYGQIEIGSSRTEYIPYSPVGGYHAIIPDTIVRETEIPPLVGLQDNVTDLTGTVTSLNGQIYENGTIGNSAGYYHTEPIELKRGESILIWGNFQYTPIWKTDSSGSYYTKPVGTRKPNPSSGSGQYGSYWYCYTATDDLEYVSVTYYDTNGAAGRAHKFYTAYLGYLENISDRFNVVNSSLDELNTSVNTLQTEVTDNSYLINYYALGSSIFTIGGYVSHNGTISSHADYAYTDYLEYSVRKNIVTYKCQSGNSYMALIAFYDSEKRFISEISNVTGTQTGDYTILKTDIPENTAYFRVSAAKSHVDINLPKIDYNITIKDSCNYNTDNISALTERVSVIENSPNVVEFSAFKSQSNALTPSSVLTISNNHIAVNFELVCKITGIIEQISFGVGYTTSSTYDYRSYDAKWIQLTQTQIKVYAYYNNGWILQNTYTHGITLTNKTSVMVFNSLDSQGTQTNVLKLYNDKGDIFTQTLSGWGVGKAFVTNDNSSGNIKVELSFMPRDITKNIWMFGDSYFGHWLQYIYECGFTKWLRNSQPGLGAAVGNEDFQNLLLLGYVPSFAVYCLGMNGSTTESQSGGDYVINPYQKTDIDNFIDICESHNITPILTCIPTVPTRQKTGFGNYIKSLNVRYIDMAEAVGSDEYGIWHGAPTLRAYTDSEENTIYVQVYGDGHTLGSGDHTFDVNGDKLSYDISSVGTDSIVVNSVTYNRNVSLDVTGLLSTDGVHPTIAGAKVIASRVILDFPEISILE